MPTLTATNAIADQCEVQDGKTGWPSGLLQDDFRPLSRWLANRVDSRRHAREAAQAIEAEPPVVLFDLEAADPVDALYRAGAL